MRTERTRRTDECGTMGRGRRWRVRSRHLGREHAAVRVTEVPHEAPYLNTVHCGLGCLGQSSPACAAHGHRAMLSAHSAAHAQSGRAEAKHAKLARTTRPPSEGGVGQGSGTRRFGGLPPTRRFANRRVGAAGCCAHNMLRGAAPLHPPCARKWALGSLRGMRSSRSAERARSPHRRFARPATSCSSRGRLDAASLILLDPLCHLVRVVHAAAQLEQLVDQDDGEGEGEHQQPVVERQRHNREDRGEDWHV